MRIIDRRSFVRSLAVTSAAVPASFRLTEVLAQPLQSDLLVMDAMGELRPEYDDALIRDMISSGMDAITVTLCDPKFEGAESLAVAIDGLLAYDRLVASRPGLLLKATSIADVDRARRERKLAVFYLFQNMTQFGADVDRVDLFYKLGLRCCQLTYNERNQAGSGCRSTGGLTEFGHALIDRMNDRRMLLDLSHANMETMADAITASRVPVHISHTGCAAVREHVRNTTDANLRALAERGGVVGICQIRPFITERKQDNLGDYIDHIDHAVQVAGIEHVCIGSDRDHRVIEMTPEYIAELYREEGPQFTDTELPLFLEALNGPRRMEVVRDALETRGYSQADIEKIMGINLYRLYRDVIG